MTHKPGTILIRVKYKQLRPKQVWVACRDRTRTRGWERVCTAKPGRGTDGKGHAAPSRRGMGDLSPRKSSLCESCS